MDDVLYIVIPCYNEQEVLPETARRIGEKIGGLIEDGKISDRSRVVFVDDGSRDNTWNQIAALHEKDRHFSGIKLSRNRGHQNALMAGLLSSVDSADMVISMDADLQDDINAIDEMVEKYYEGCDVVYGVRKSREKDSFFKRFTAEGYYKLITAIGGEIVYNHADYRLLSKRALKALAQFGETNLFLRGLVPMLGFKSAVVTYDRSERFAGQSKYSVKKMLGLAVDGITSLSAKPIRMVLSIGAIIFILGLIALIYALILSITGGFFPGWAVTTVSVWACAGLIMISIGIVGEYVGKIYLETKRRPRYIIDAVLHHD
ncbi:MAG: glycosyltransferase family 2 protein [Clostridiales bacterium]|mgnify:CR=1 FL=1|nr:glycosyltransferase family 2 protein [Clostridiales bacterium]